MTGPEDAVAPHSAAEVDPRGPSRAANQVRDEPIPPRGVNDDITHADSNRPDSAADDHDSQTLEQEERRADLPQAGVPDSTVTDVTPALGTSEELRPVQGVHTPDVGPGGQQIDTADSAERSRVAGTD